MVSLFTTKQVFNLPSNQYIHTECYDTIKMKSMKNRSNHVEVLCKKSVLKISQNSRGNNCARVYFIKNTSVSLRIQSKCGKIRTRKNSVLGHFSHSEPLQSGMMETRYQARHSIEILNHTIRAFSLQYLIEYSAKVITA